MCARASSARLISLPVESPCARLSYAMTSNLGNSAGGPYTATLFYDGSQLQVVSIAAN